MSVIINGEEVVDGETESEKAARLAEEAEGNTNADNDDNGSNDDGTETGDLTFEIEGEESAASEDDADDVPEEELEVSPPWVKKLREKNKADSKALKEANRVAAELQKQLEEARKAPEAQLPALGEKPTLEGCDYDTELFEQQLDDWKAVKAKVEAKQEEVKQVEQAQIAAYNLKVDAYDAAKAKLALPDYQVAEDKVKSALSVMQQGVAITYAKDPATLAYALGKNPAVLAKLASISDPIEFVIELRELENKLKVTRKPKTAPETKLTGGGKLTDASDSKLESLRKKAAETGDYTEVTAYKRQLREKK